MKWKIKDNKIAGYIILIVGLLIMAFSIISVYSVFTTGNVPIEILQTPAGETVVDMGQNMVGWIRLKVEGEAGTVVKLRHAEVLEPEELRASIREEMEIVLTAYAGEHRAEDIHGRRHSV